MKNLIVQAQRLGDIVMTYPLFTWLRKQSNKELLVLGERKFYEELIKISPQVTYIPTEKMDFLKNFHYETIINLSHREDTAKLVSELRCESFFGLSVKSENNEQIKTINGAWQLYRASLTHNNHYNHFHWADLNALDCIELETIKNTTWQKPVLNDNKKIGIFVGASDTAKRPEPQFFSELAIQLNKKGYNPIFIAGPAKEEIQLAYNCAKNAGIPRGVIPGHLSIYELVSFLQTLQLFITPDTGPMHIASFANIPTLNLSVGPVHPWETAPYPPNHYVLRSSISCSGCWQCTKKSQLCRKAFVPHRVANLVHALLQNKTLPQIPSLLLYKTSRDSLGLYKLEPLLKEKSYHNIQADFWKYFFLYEFANKKIAQEEYDKGKEALFTSLPLLQGLLQKEHLKLLKSLVISEKTGKILDKNAWQNYFPLFRPLTSYTQLLLENNDYSKESRSQVMEILENFHNVIS